MKTKSSAIRRNYFVPNDLARRVGCPEKKIREYCKQGKIREAKRTPGGQWRILKPLSRKTRGFLQLEAWRVDWPWLGNGEEVRGDVEPELMESLMLAHLLNRDSDKLYDTEIDESTLSESQKKALEQFEQLIAQDEIERAKNLIAKRKGEKFTKRSTLQKRVSELKLHGFVKQFCLKHGCRPTCPLTVVEVSQMMGISSSEFYRRGLSSQKLKLAYRIASEEFLSVAPEARDHDSIERANKAKKPGFAQLNCD